jgi:hypothetical protein
MPDALTTFMKLIQSPPGQLVAGGALAGIVWKFFERVESVLNENTKLEIAIWLLGRKKLSPSFQNWPDTFAKVFDQVFGKRHLSWKCFDRSTTATTISFWVGIGCTLSFQNPWMRSRVPTWFSFGHRTLIDLPLFNLILVALLFAADVYLPDYVLLLKSRYCLHVMTKMTSISGSCIVLVIDTLVTTFISALSACLLALLVLKFGPRPDATQCGHYIEVLTSALSHPLRLVQEAVRMAQVTAIVLFPAFWTSIWLWLYAGSGFILKAARRFDIGFDWFNRHFDIEKKPLQSIGLVAGALVAVLYWGAAFVVRVWR